MKRAAAPDAGAELSRIGRATRRDGAGGREIWRLAEADEAVASRLLKLGRSNVGGFVDGGIDGGGIWLVRRIAGTALSEAIRARKGPWAWREALAIGVAIARALAACEAASIFPGPVSPDAVLVDDGGATLVANALVRALVGAADASATRDASSLSPMWIPPPQADGAVWDAAANRYALGLVMYRLLAGEHPFAGAGLRHAMGDASHREAAPFVESVAKALPSGLQSFTLRLIDVDVAHRPKDAAAIAEELDAFLHPGAKRDSLVSAVDAGSRGREEEKKTGNGNGNGNGNGRREKRSERREKRASALDFRTFWPIAAGTAIALGAFAMLAPAPETKAGGVAVAAEAPLTQSRTAATDCASCHARQAAEWRRSVMAHAVKSPLFNALEILIEEQVGRDRNCPNGAGILRRASSATACRVGAGANGQAVTGSGGEHWCVNCHSPSEKLDTRVPPWEGRADGSARSRLPVRDLLGDRAMEGISCGFCHQVHGPVPARGQARGAYEGNATWTSFVTGTTFAARPEDGRGLTGIGNSGYDLRPEDFLPGAGSRGDRAGPHLRPPRAAKAYLRSSEFCGSCHDVRLFGTDVLGARQGEHFKRLRNAYSEWASWAKDETRAGRSPASCQDCHMSAFPGVCEPAPGEDGDADCPKGSRFAARAPGSWPKGRPADNSRDTVDVVTHWFSGVDVPLSREFPAEIVDEQTLDAHGIPLSARRRRDMLLRRTFRFDLGAARRGGRGIEIPLEVENTGAGHRVPAGFSQEREFWVHLVVRDGDGRLLYEVGRVDRNDEDLHDKELSRVNVRDDNIDRAGRPQGLFGADVRDGRDAPAWSPPPHLGGTQFRGKGLVNFQNGFLRCVRCIGTIAADGHCEAGPGQGTFRADRFVDGDYDLDTGACLSNLTGQNALFETYFPIGALDASRGIAKGPDAIIDTRSLPPSVPIKYVYDLGTEGRRGPFKIEARLLFRAFPPFLIKGFAAYEREQARRGLRPSGPLVTDDMLARLEVVELARREAEIR